MRINQYRAHRPRQQATLIERIKQRIGLMQNERHERLPLQKIRRIQVIAILMMVLGASLWIKNLLTNPNHWPIKNVEIKGDTEHVSQALLSEIIQKYTRSNLYQLNDIGLETDLEALDWIKNVRLQKSWPSSLAIYITEHKPIAAWGETHLLDQHGEIFKGQLSENPVNFPKLYSPENKGLEMSQDYLKISQKLSEIPLRLTGLQEDARGSWQINFEEGLIVKIGVYEQDKRLRRFIAGYNTVLARQLSKISIVDLRYTNGFAVEWK